MTFAPSQPYNDLPLLPPQVDLEKRGRETIYKHPALLKLLTA